MKVLTLAVVFLTTTVSLAAARIDDVRPSHGSRHVIVEAEHILLPSERTSLATRGIRIVKEVGGRRYLAVVTSRNVADDAIARIVEIDEDAKIFPSARKRMQSLQPIVRAQIVFHPDVTPQRAAEVIAAAAGTPLSTEKLYDLTHMYEAAITRGAIERLASRDEVAQIHAATRRISSHNATAAVMAKVTDVHAAPYNLTGAGVVVGVGDIGNVQATHPEFEGRVTAQSGTSPSQHPTHVTGTIAAKGIQPQAKGMAPGVTLHQFAVDNGFLEQKERDYPRLALLAENNSWGFTFGWNFSSERNSWEWWDYQEEFGAYGIETAGLDSLSIRFGTLVVYSAGNDNTDTGPTSAPFQHFHDEDPKVYCTSSNGSGTDCTSPCAECELQKHPIDGPWTTMNLIGSAKNVLAIGAVDSNNQIASFSSRGPTRDGRIKPDVVAKGVSQYSTVPGSAYGRLNGTSMASPVVTGISALLIEQWRRTNGTQNPPASVLRGLIIHSGRDLGNPGPDYTYGFGHVDAKNAVDTIIADNAAGLRIKRAEVTQGTTHEFKVTVAAGQTARTTLVWEDPVQTPYVLPSLINDLDLKVIDSAGGVTLPLILDPNNPTTPAVRGVNTRDNVEQIDWSSPTGGVYTIRVSGTRVASATPQAFTLLSTHDFGAAAPPCTDPFEPNDSQGAAYGRLPNNATLSAALCSQGDIDVYRFVVDRSGTVSVIVNSIDTPLRVTLTVGSQSSSTTIASGASGTTSLVVPGNGAITPQNAFVTVQSNGTNGATARYSIKATYPSSTNGRNRTIRR